MRKTTDALTPPAHRTGRASAERVAFERAGIRALGINTIRTLSMDAVQKANSGHPGTQKYGFTPERIVEATRELLA